MTLGTAASQYSLYGGAAVHLAVAGAFLWCVGAFFWRLFTGRMSLRDFPERHGWWLRLWYSLRNPALPDEPPPKAGPPPREIRPASPPGSTDRTATCNRPSDRA